MRFLVTACAAAVAIVAAGYSDSAHAQDWLRDAIAPENRVHDFGTVARAAKTEHRFYIKNTTNSELHLASVRASCGCTTPIIETQRIKPNETGSILARFNTGTFTGSKSATLTVTIAKPVFTELQLNVRGYIRSDVVLNPGEINFGAVPVGEPRTAEITLDYAGRSDWQVTGIESPLDAVDVSFEEVSRVGGRIQYKIVASLEETAPVGNLQNQLLLRTNDRNLTTVPLRFFADVQAPIQVSPQAIALGSVQPGSSVQQRLTIKSQQPFKLTKIRSDQAEIGFEPSDDAKLAHLINFEIKPQALEKGREVSGTIELHTDLMSDPLRVPLTFTLSEQAPDATVAQSNP